MLKGRNNTTWTASQPRKKCESVAVIIVSPVSAAAAENVKIRRRRNVTKLVPFATETGDGLGTWHEAVPDGMHPDRWRK